MRTQGLEPSGLKTTPPGDTRYPRPTTPTFTKFVVWNIPLVSDSPKPPNIISLLPVSRLLLFFLLRLYCHRSSPFPMVASIHGPVLFRFAAPPVSTRSTTYINRLSRVFLILSISLCFQTPVQISPTTDSQ